MSWVIEDPEVPPRKFLVSIFQHMKNKYWKKEGKPNWWVRIGTGNASRFLPIEPMPGNEPLFIELDLEDLKVPLGETLYVGVGSPDPDVGVRDEYNFKSATEGDPHNLVFYAKPKPFITDVSHGHVWYTRDFRYRIRRVVPDPPPEKGGYEAHFAVINCTGGYLRSTEHPGKDLQECLKVVIADASSRYHLDEGRIAINDDQVLFEAAFLGLDYLPDPVPTKVKTVITKEMKNDKPVKIKVNVREGPNMGKEEIQQRILPTRRVGVVKAMIHILRKASKKHPITKEEIVKKLKSKFPEKSVDNLRSTVNARIADLPKRHGIRIKKRGKGFWSPT